MRCLIWVEQDMWTADVTPAERAYVEQVVWTGLAPLSEAEYRDGPAAMLHTDVPYSYVLHEGCVLWLVAWPPGLLALRFSPDGSMSWGAFEALPEAGDEEERDPQAHLVFDPWDAQLDEQELEWGGFAPAPAEVEQAWEAATAAVQRIGEEIAAQVGDDEAALEAWFERCQASPVWKGELRR